MVIAVRNSSGGISLCVFVGFNTRPQQALLLNWHQLQKERTGTEGDFHDLHIFHFLLLLVNYAMLVRK